MAAKKGKGKKESTGKNNAEVARLALLRAQEADAERFLRRESERRQRDEVEERIAFLRDEQARALREKDNQLAAATQGLQRAVAARQTESAALELQLQELRHHRDVAQKEVDLSRGEMEELRGLVERERAATAMQVSQLRETLEAERRAHDDDRQRLRAQASEALAQAEVLRQRLQRVCDEKDFATRSHALQQRETTCELEKAVAAGKAMRAALAERDTDGRKNVALLQLLNAQLEEDTRRRDEAVSAEQTRTRRAEDEVARLTSACSAAHAALDTAKRAALEAKHTTDAELHELRQLLEQMKFDAAYLHRELDATREEHRVAAERAAAAAQATQAELQQTRVECAAATKRAAEVEALALRKEREHFDAVTFLNAQVSNGRTTIAQLREELRQHRHHHRTVVQHLEAANAKAAQELAAQVAAEEERNTARRAEEQSVLKEMAALQTTTAELREQLSARATAQEETRATQEAEIARLRGVLDAHFIPNRQEVAVARESARVDEVFVLKGELHAMEERAAQRERARQETEALLRSRIADQMDAIAALQLDLKRAQLGGRESVHTLEKEVGRLQKTLEIHRIPAS